MAKNKGIKAWAHLKLPQKEELQYKLDNFVQTGVLRPEEAEAIKQDPSALQNFMENPDLMASQQNSLRQMEQLGQGKMTDVDQANLVRQLQVASQQERANRESILSNARQRGIAGSGLELAAQLEGEQGAANRGNQAVVDAQAMAQQRGIQALQNAGQMAGQMRGQEFDVASRKAAAADAINQWNAQNQQSVLNQTIAARNAAAAQNLAEQQRIADANVGNTNKEREIAANAAQQDFVNRMQKVQGYSAALAAKKGQKGAATGSMLGTVGTLGGAAIGAFFGGPTGAATGASVGGAVGNAVSDERAKKDVEKWDAGAFLDKIAPVKFRYKPEMDIDNEEHHGVMAQDVEKGAPEAVYEENGVKHLDMNKLVPLILASVADLNRKIKEKK